jgi:hypothetical protein
LFSLYLGRPSSLFLPGFLTEILYILWHAGSNPEFWSQENIRC